MKRCRFAGLFIMVVQIMFFSSACSAAPADVWNGGSEPFDMSVAGDEANPYIIDTARKLAYLAQQVNSGEGFPGKWFELTKDLDLAGIEWDPIGHSKSAQGESWSRDLSFRGHFNGGAHVVSNLNITNGGDFCGLFGIVQRGSVRDLRLKNAYIRTRNEAGAIAATVSENARISGCFVEGRIESENNPAGGVVGNLLAASLSDCEFAGSVIGSKDTGGLVGIARGEINRCAVNGDITGVENVGGLVGNNSSKILESKSGGVVRGRIMVGGLVGRTTGSGDALVKCVSASNVEGARKGGQVGGLLGGTMSFGYGDTIIIECTAGGSVFAENSYAVGGLVGRLDNAEKVVGCAATGAVTGKDDVGGLIGFLNHCEQISDNRASGDVTGEKNVDALCGRAVRVLKNVPTDIEKGVNNIGSGKVTVLN
jgi:hypothetical protein